MDIAGLRADPSFPAIETSTVAACIRHNCEAPFEANATSGNFKRYVCREIRCISEQTLPFFDHDVFVTQSQEAEQGLRVSSANAKQRPGHVFFARRTNAFHTGYYSILGQGKIRRQELFNMASPTIRACSMLA